MFFIQSVLYRKFHCNNISQSFSTVDVDVHVEVISARKGTFIVTCTAKGGTVLRSSLSGPDGVNYTLNLVGTMNMRGDDTYSITTGMILRATNGDTYTCIATNRAGNQLVADIDPTDSEKLKGIHKTRLTVHIPRSILILVYCSCQSPNHRGC